jgi:hypothetical protein
VPASNRNDLDGGRLAKSPAFSVQDIKTTYGEENVMKNITYALSALMTIAVLAGCAATQKVEIKPGELNCVLLGPDCSKLTPGGKDQLDLRYINPAAQWTTYSKIMIEPVTFWAGESTKIKPVDQQMLVNYFKEQLHQQIGKKFQIVQEPGAGVMKLQVALTDASGATPFLRSVSMIVPQAHLLSSLKYLATDSFPFVGGAQAEAKVTDSVSGEVLGEFADREIGGGAFKTGFQWKWGDAENAINKWCEIAATGLSSWTSGAATP